MSGDARRRLRRSRTRRARRPRRRCRSRRPGACTDGRRSPAGAVLGDGPVAGQRSGDGRRRVWTQRGLRRLVEARRVWSRPRWWDCPRGSRAESGVPVPGHRARRSCSGGGDGCAHDEPAAALGRRERHSSFARSSRAADLSPHGVAAVPVGVPGKPRCRRQRLHGSGLWERGRSALRATRPRALDHLGRQPS